MEGILKVLYVGGSLWHDKPGEKCNFLTSVQYSPLVFWTHEQTGVRSMPAIFCWVASCHAWQSYRRARATDGQGMGDTDVSAGYLNLMRGCCQVQADACFAGCHTRGTTVIAYILYNIIQNTYDACRLFCCLFFFVFLFCICFFFSWSGLFCCRYASISFALP